jgi:hypothetical protein
MFKLSLILLLLSSSIIYAQTKAIAFKSHSGNPAYYPSDGDGNFGIVEPMPTLDSIVKINDSTTIHYHNTVQGPFYYDTLVNHPFWSQPNINIDSLKKDYQYRQAQFIGFKAKRKKKNNLHLVKPMNGKSTSTTALNPTQTTNHSTGRKIEIIGRIHARLN